MSNISLEELSKKAAEQSAASTPPTTKQVKEESEKVTIDKITLDNILERLAAVEGAGDSVALQKQQVKLKRNNTAKVRFMDEEMNKLVVGYGKSWQKTEVGGRRFLVLEVISEDRKTNKREKTEVEGVPFMEQGIFVDAEIINIDRQEIETQLGFVNETKVDYDNYRSYETDKQIPLVVKSVKAVYTMRLPNKEEVRVPEEGLN